jgi:Flp pilus assembly pilin Flp
MRPSPGGKWGPIEYILIIIVIALILVTLFSLFWPAIQLFYETTLK